MKCHVHTDVGEEYTSKTCGRCGWQPDGKLSSSKVFLCRRCGFQCDRDWNAARNIFLKNIRQCVGERKTSTQNNTNLIAGFPGSRTDEASSIKRPKTGHLFLHGSREGKRFINNKRRKTKN